MYFERGKSWPVHLVQTSHEKEHPLKAEGSGVTLLCVTTREAEGLNPWSQRRGAYEAVSSVEPGAPFRLGLDRLKRAHIGFNGSPYARV
jgi:hypothetical protein